MNQTVKSIVWCGLIFAATWVAGRAQYSLEKLVGVNGDSDARFNNQDQVIAGAKVWTNGVVTTLSGLGGSYAAGRTINNHGDIVGYAWDQNSVTHAVVWKGGAISDLGAISSNLSIAVNGINDLGQIVGTVTTAGVNRAVVWSGTGGVPVTIDGVPGYQGNYGEAINNHGVVAGLSTPLNDRLAPTAFVRYATGLALVGSSGNIYGSSIADINDSGIVVGSQNGFAFWYDGSFHEIGPFGYGRNGATAVNAYGEIVGSLYTDGKSRPFAYINGVLTDLDALFPNVLPPNLHFEAALDINDKGDILLRDEGNSLYLARADNPHPIPGLSPVPEPATFGLFAASGLIGLVISKRRRFSSRQVSV